MNNLESTVQIGRRCNRIETLRRAELSLRGFHGLELPLGAMILIFSAWTLSYQVTFVMRLPSIAVVPLFGATTFVLLRHWANCWRQRLQRGVHHRVDKWVYILLVLIASGIAVLSLFYGRANIDDILYIHRAIIQRNHLWSPFFITSTLHNAPQIYEVPSYFLGNSYEMLTVFISVLTGVHPLTVYHNWSFAFFVFCLPFIYFLIYRLLHLKQIPALAATLCAILFLFLDGNSGKTFGSCAFLHLWQGKAVLLTILAPLALYITLRFMHTPGCFLWAILLGLQICGYGFSSTGLIMIPSLVFLVSTACLTHLLLDKKESPKDLFQRYLVANSTSAYCLTLGLLFFTGVIPLTRHTTTAQFGDWLQCLNMVFGGTAGLLWAAGLLLAVPWMALEFKSARLIVLITLSAILFLHNPIIGSLFASASPIYYRMALIIPVPLCAGLLVPAICKLFSSRQKYWKIQIKVLFLAGLLVSYMLHFDLYTLAPQNHVFSKSPANFRIKPQYAFIGNILARHLDDRNLLAPEELAYILPLLNFSVRIESGYSRATFRIFKDNQLEKEGLRRLAAQQLVTSGYASAENSEALKTSLNNGVDAVIATASARQVVLEMLAQTKKEWHEVYRDQRFTLFLLDRA